MRSSRTGSAAAAVAAALIVTAAIPRGAVAYQYDVAKILRENRPVHHQWVDIDKPTDPAAIAACTTEIVPASRSGGAAKGSTVVIRDGQGRTLCRFADVTGDEGGKVDLWCFYKDGFEVYRDVDYNDDGRVDECRWLNTAGTRIAVMRPVAGEKVVSRITSWRRLTAQEASQVLVQALVAGDPRLLETVMATPEELDALGLPKGLVEQSRADAKGRAEAVDTLIQKLLGWGWTNATAWLRFDADMPHLIPADASAGLKEDLLLFENAVVFAGDPSAMAELGRAAYLQVPEIVQIGEVWKFVGLPRAFNPDPSGTEVIAAFDGIRSWLYRGNVGSAEASGGSPELEKALRALADFDAEAASVFEQADPKEIARYHYDRVIRLGEVIKAAPPAERLDYEKERINSLAAAYQTGEYPAGKDMLNRLIKAGGPLGSYAAYSLIPAEYMLRADGDPDKVIEAERAWIADLQRFLEDHPKAIEVPEALIQLARVKEFNGNEADARDAFERLAKDYDGTPDGLKGAGALKRLGLDGKTLELSGLGPNGETVDAASMRGTHLLVVFGAFESAALQRELPEINDLVDRRKDSIAVLGVSLDEDPEAAQSFATQTSWPTIVDEGGMDGRLAIEYGIISPPTMLLVGPDGKVIDHDIRSVAEVEGHLDQAVAKKDE